MRSTELVFVPDPKDQSGTDPEIYVPGWDIETFEIVSTQHAYPGDEIYSRLVFKLTISRSIVSSILKSFLPIGIITLISLLSFLISPKNHGQRIGLGVTTLMAAVASHLALTSQIPPIGYLTFADKVMITAYGLFLYNLTVSVVTMRFVEQERTEGALRINRRAGYLIPVVAVLLFLLLHKLA